MGEMVCSEFGVSSVHNMTCTMLSLRRTCFTHNSLKILNYLSNGSVIEWSFDFCPSCSALVVVFYPSFYFIAGAKDFN